MSDEVQVSVVIPCFNGARHLANAVESVLTQKHGSLDIVVVDDGSTDETRAVAKKLGNSIRLVTHEENRGLAPARNSGLQAATGEIISFLDVDDLWLPQKLAIQLPLLLSQPELDGVWGMGQIMMLADSPHHPLQFHPTEPPKHWPQLGCFLFRRRLFDQLGSFDIRQSHADDIDLLSRAQAAGMLIQQHKDVVMHWQRHDKNMTNDVGPARKDFIAAIKRSLERKRQANN